MGNVLGGKIRPSIEGKNPGTDNQRTFFGVLDRFYELEGGLGISKDWRADSTLKGYKNAYENVIFPEIDERPLVEYTKEDFQDVIDRICSKKRYSEKRIKDFKRLIKAVTREAEVQGVCPDALFGTDFALTGEEGREAELHNERVKLRKSLSIDEEVFLAKHLLTDPMKSGESMGLAFMFCIGFRNAEVCALDFDDIKPMTAYPDVYCAWAYTTTSAKSSKKKARGKTKNATRVVPLPKVLSDLVLKRKACLEAMVKSGELVLENGIDSLGTLPIVCEGLNYTKRCYTKHLTAEGRIVLKEAKIEEEELSYIDRALDREEYYGDGIKEKDPTAYLCRRNLGTHLYILGMDEAEIQYVMGHQIEDAHTIRNDFINEDMLYAIKKKMDFRPLVNPEFVAGVCEEKDENIDTQKFENLTKHESFLQIQSKEEAFLVHAFAREPNDRVFITVEKENGVKLHGSLHRFSISQGKHRPINITKAYKEAYRKYQARGSVKTEKERS